MQLTSRQVRAGAVAALAAASLVVGSLAGASASVADGRDGQRVHDAKTAKPKPKKPIKLDLLAINDFHGQLEVVPPSSSSGRINTTPAGGAAYLAALLEEERAASRADGAKAITVAAGDLIGASPLLSAAFHDEPTIEAMNEMGLQVSAVGNHEFDEGWRELRRMQNGGCLKDGDGENGADSCPGGKKFKGADFRYLGANVVWKDQKKRKRSTVFPAVKVMHVKKGKKVAFIGMTLEATDTIVSPAGIQEIDFTDEVETANALVPKLRKRGIKSIVVLLHEGVAGDSSVYNGCVGVSGPGLAIAQNLDPEIDAVVSGHTHQPYNCVVDDPNGQPRLLTSASSLGRIVTKLHFEIDARSGDIIRPTAYANNTIVENGPSEPTSQGILDLISLYTTLVAPIRDEVIGHIDPGTEILRLADPNGGDSPLGNLIADAQKVDTTVAGNGAPVIALMNSGGIRADLIEDASGNVTYGAAFSVQPFNNLVSSIDLTGAEIKAILNQQWNGNNEGTNRRILQVSGLSYTWDLSAALEVGADALVGDVMVDDDGDPGTAMVPLVDGDTYRVVANNFIMDGGDSFTGFSAGENRINGGLDIDSLRNYLLANNPVAPTPTDRISQVD